MLFEIVYLSGLFISCGSLCILLDDEVKKN